MKIRFAAIVFAALMGALAQAQTYELGIMGGYSRLNRPALGSISVESPGDYDTRMKAESTIGAWLGLNTRGYYGHEFNYQITYAQIKTTTRATTDNVTTTSMFQDRVAIHRAGYNFLVYFMPNGSRWRPFFTAGAHAAQYQSPNIANWTYGGGRHYGVNYGLGLKLIPMAHTLFRVDLRDYINGKPYDLTFSNSSTLTGGVIHQYQASAGFAITF